MAAEYRLKPAFGIGTSLSHHRVSARLSDSNAIQDPTNTTTSPDCGTYHLITSMHMAGHPNFAFFTLNLHMRISHDKWTRQPS